MATAPRVRPLAPGDAQAVRRVMLRSFDDLGRRFGRPPHPPPPEAASLARIEHLIATDPGGALAVAGPDGELAGAALALMREGVWGLSLLVVDPGAQSHGIGSALLRSALEYAGGARGAIILSSEDSRALRAYARAGFDLDPVLEASGVPRALPPAPSVRPGDRADLALAERIDRAVRGAAHGPDLEVLLDHGDELLVHPDRGYAIVRKGALILLAALDEPAAQALLRAAIASVPAGEAAEVGWITSHQRWAIPVVLEAGLGMRVGGAVMVRGDVGPFRPYLPSGAYL